jgi:hypothetical protein
MSAVNSRELVPLQWNYFNGNVSAEVIQDVADALHTTGLAELGFRQINIDSGYLLRERAADGSLQVSPLLRDSYKRACGWIVEPCHTCPLVAPPI